MKNGVGVRRIALLIGLILVASCGDEKGSGVSFRALDDQFSHTYLYCANCSDHNMECHTRQFMCRSDGCTTGTQSFATKKETCVALNDARRNNFCAADERRTAFYELGCEGVFKGR